jgi:hypothetical protein
MFSKLFSDNGDISMMRVMAFLALIFGASVAILGMFLGKDLNQLATLSGVFVGAGFGGKMIQKFAEVKSAVSGDSK